MRLRPHSYVSYSSWLFEGTLASSWQEEKACTGTGRVPTHVHHLQAGCIVAQPPGRPQGIAPTIPRPALPMESSGAVQATPRSTLKLVCMGDASVPTLPP